MDACYKGTHVAPLEKPLALVLSLLSFLPFMVQCSVQEIPPLSVSVPMILQNLYSYFTSYSIGRGKQISLSPVWST